jgi:hypothetical protein
MEADLYLLPHSTTINTIHLNLPPAYCTRTYMEAERSQRGQPPQLLRDRLELVLEDRELRQAGHAADLRRQRAQLVLLQAEDLHGARDCVREQQAQVQVI